MARYTFAKVSRSIGLRGPVVAGRRRGRGPRLHDMRHRFAVQTLLNWYRAGADVEREIPKLATYLGHAHVNDTYWYLEAVPELLHLAAARLDRRCDGGWA
jgi:integrase